MDLKFRFNAPNTISIIRMSLVPLFAIVLLAKIPHRNVFSAIIFGLLSVSDFFDGYLARKKNQVTEFGKLLDPIADKLLISTALIFLTGRGVELWMTISIIAREVILTAIRIYLIPSKIIIPAGHFGKAKTVMQSIAIVFVLLNFPFSRLMMYVAVFLTLFSGAEYLVQIRKMTGNKVVNLPNLITLTRFLLIAPFVYYLYHSETSIALLIFSAITLSDKLDGISARVMNQKTELGSGLDSFTDWTVMDISLIMFIVKGYISPAWLVLLLIPSATSGIMKMIYAKKNKKVPVSIIAQLSVALIYITILVVIIGFGYSINPLKEIHAYLLTAAVLLAYAAMIHYILKVWRPRSS